MAKPRRNKQRPNPPKRVRLANKAADDAEAEILKLSAAKTTTVTVAAAAAAGHDGHTKSIPCLAPAIAGTTSITDSISSTVAATGALPLRSTSV